MRKKLLFSLLVMMFIVLLLPSIQQFANFPKVSPLKGAVTFPRMPKLSLKAYFNASLQDSMDKWVENHVGFRPDLVRLHNQIQYSFFDTINAKGVIFGKDDYLFEFNYIKALYGLNFVGYDKITKDAQETQFVNNWLTERNKHLFVIFAPGKASFYPDKVPDLYKPDTAIVTNNQVYTQKFAEAGIPFIDCNKYFLSIKDTSRFILYPKSGIHWSYYGMGLIFDSVLKSMEQLQGKRFIDFGIKKMEVSKKLRSPDQDLWEGMNIFIEPNDPAMPYPEFYFENPDKEAMPRVIVVSDSFYWQWFGGGYAKRSFKSHDFWYYNAQVISGSGKETVERHNADILARVMATDFIILLQTDANMDRYSFGFIHELFEAIQKHSSLSQEDLLEIEKIMEGMRSNANYLKSIEEKAIKRHVPLEEALRGDAMWVFENKKKNAAQK